jgi:adenylosuccinate lyase
MNNIVSSLQVDEESMLKNTEVTQGRFMSEAVMMALTRKGMNRQEAHELLRKLTIKSELQKRGFGEVLLEDSIVSQRLTKREVDAALNPKNYLGTAARQVELMVKKTKRERKSRGQA